MLVTFFYNVQFYFINYFKLKTNLFLDFNNDEENETDYKMNISQTLDEKQTISLHKKPAYNNISTEIKNQLEELDEHENKIKQMLLKNIYMYENENKILTEKNKSVQKDLKLLNTYFKDVQVDRNNWEVYYKTLQSEKKYLLTKLESTKEVKENNDAELSTKWIKITKENTHTSQLYSKRFFAYNLLSKMKYI